MLRLRRRVGERIVVIPPDSGPIRVTVVEVDGGKVWIGVEADADTKIYREEVYRRVLEERPQPQE